MTESGEARQRAPITLRKTAALVAAVVLCVVLVTPFVVAIKRYDWGVALLLVAPVWVWLLLRIGRALERWACNAPDALPPDPDFPEEADPDQ